MSVQILRSVIRDILILEGGLEPQNYPKGYTPGKKYTANDEINFGPWLKPEIFPGQDSSKLVLKLNLSASEPEKSFDLAKKLGALPVPESYLVKGSTFERELSSRVTSPVAVARNLEIAKAKSDDDVKKSFPYNGSQNFYVVVDADNKNIRDAKEIQKYEEFKDSVLGTLLSNPASGLGKIVNRLPADQRASLLKKFHDVAFISSVASGAGSLSSLAASRLAALSKFIPGAKAFTAATAAASIGPYLLLASSALDKGDSGLAATYLFNALASGLVGWFETVEAVNLINKTPLQAGQTMTALERIAGQKVDTLDSLITFLDNLKKAFPTYEQWKLQSDVFRTLPPLEFKLIDWLVSDPRYLTTMITSIKEIWSNVKSVIAAAFPVGIDVYGIKLDLEDLGRQEAVSASTEAVKSASADVIAAFKRTFISDVHQKMMRFTKTRNYQDFYDRNRKSGQTVVVNIDDEILPRKVIGAFVFNNKPIDFLVLTKEYYDAIDQIIRFNSIDNPRNILEFDDRNRALLVIPRAAVEVATNNN
jgi:hypothetical protein